MKAQLFKHKLGRKEIVIDKQDGQIRVGQKQGAGWVYGEWKDEQVLYITLARLLR